MTAEELMAEFTLLLALTEELNIEITALSIENPDGTVVLVE